MLNASRNSISHKHLPLAQADSSVWRPRGWQRGSWAGDPWHIRIAAHREKYPCVCPASSVSALHGEQQHPEICPKPGMRGQAAQRGALQPPGPLLQLNKSLLSASSLVNSPCLSSREQAGQRSQPQQPPAAPVRGANAGSRDGSTPSPCFQPKKSPSLLCLSPALPRGASRPL